MTTHLLLPSLFRRAALPLAVLVFALVGADRANAGCGDHVIVLKSAGVQQQTDADSHPSKYPCHGPNCTANPPGDPIPPVTTTVIHPTTAKEVFTPVEPCELSGSSVVRRPFEFSPPRPIDRPSSIFHPPRV
jgi:hypothetical protein